VYCRLLKLPCLTTADLNGDKSAVEIDMHYAPSGAMIRHLFDRFDKNRDGDSLLLFPGLSYSIALIATFRIGFLSVAEFKTMLKEVNLEFSQLDIDVIYHRFDDSPR